MILINIQEQMQRGPVPAQNTISRHRALALMSDTSKITVIGISRRRDPVDDDDDDADEGRAYGHRMVYFRDDLTNNTI